MSKGYKIPHTGKPQGGKGKTMYYDKNHMIDKIQAKYKKHLENGFITENECNYMCALWETRRYTPAVFYTNGGDYFNLYTITETDGEIIGTYAAIIAGRNAGKHETIVYKSGYTKRDINKLYKEYRI